MAEAAWRRTREILAMTGVCFFGASSQIVRSVLAIFAGRSRTLVTAIAIITLIGVSLDQGHNN